MYSIERFKTVHRKRSEQSSLVVVIAGVLFSLVAVFGAVGLIILGNYTIIIFYSKLNIYYERSFTREP